MERDLMRRPALPMNFGRVDWPAAAVWLGSFALVAYLGLRGGGYDPLVHETVGIAIWWVLLAAVAVAAIPRHRIGTLAWVALGLFFALVCWGALSLAWTESIDKTWGELARALGYLGVFAFAVFACGPGRIRTLVGAVSAAIVLIAIIALLSRVHADWFPEASQTARFLADGRERLSYPLNYWNALGALMAIGLPVTLLAATAARSLLLRAAAAAALPALCLVLFLTLSRGGIAAAGLAVAVFFVLSDDRLPKALTVAVAAAGAAVLILAADSRDAFQHAFFSPAGERQGDEMAPIILVTCLAVGLLQALIGLGSDRGLRPRWTRPSRRQSLVSWAAILVVALIAAVAIGLPGRAADAWDEFKQGDVPSAGTARLQTLSGESRYELWEAALDQNASAPLEGTGAGTFEYWWARNGGPEVVRDAHSLYLQVLGELGVVGFLLLVAFLLAIPLAGVVSLRAGDPARAALAAAIAGFVAFCLTAAVDWVWQVPVVPVAALLLGGGVVSQRFLELRNPRGAAIPWRLGFAGMAIVAIVAIAVPLASATLLRRSEDAAGEGNLAAALADARSAQNVQPGAAAPRLQEALVLEAQARLPDALAAARAATEREATNWRNWLVLARIEAESGRASAAVRDYRRAEMLNPHFSLFSR